MERGGHIVKRGGQRVERGGERVERCGTKGGERETYKNVIRRSQLPMLTFSGGHAVDPAPNKHSPLGLRQIMLAYSWWQLTWTIRK